MAGNDSGELQTGRSGLIVRVPEAEPAVRAWRDRLDPSARAGVPAHVTVLFPFLDESRIDNDACAALGEVIGRHRSFETRFEHCGRFPGILYLVPEPDIPFRRLTEAIADRWPEAPPFGGQFDDVVPHLTIAQGQDDAVLEEAEADLRSRLPVTARVSSVDLLVHDGTRWQQRASFALR
ncbi:2'-5' RNA ligase family protein [Streptomyces caniscabiei]|uniref:2'-5' RNA ligase family protein n=1 Tax=Streptomyces caniscabiei TaxID=2746961 RepID=UPI0007660713|nr:2'-5' RNA ligase family protein [Streptomyces caniscabiei]